MPAKCNYCGHIEPVYACKACRRKLSAESKRKTRSPIRHCRDCGTWTGSGFVIARPRKYCEACIAARQAEMEAANE